jgi:hypothetical protein
MADFTVDYGVLQQIEKALTSLKSEFSNIDAVRHAANWGHSDIDSKMGSFASNWSHHRQKLLGSMDAMLKNVHETLTGTDQYDTKLQHQLTGN